MKTPDTLKILKSVQAELRKAQQAHEKNPSVKTYDLVRYCQDKVMQYSARAMARKAQP